MRVPLSTKQYQLVLTMGGDAVKQRCKEPHSIFTARLQLVNRGSRRQWVDEERPSGLWLTRPNQQCQHPGRVTCNHSNRHSPAFNWLQTPVSKSRLWLTQLHNYSPNILTRLIGQPQLQSGWAYRTWLRWLPTCLMWEFCKWRHLTLTLLLLLPYCTSDVKYIYELMSPNTSDSCGEVVTCCSLFVFRVYCDINITAVHWWCLFFQAATESEEMSVDDGHQTVSIETGLL